MDLDLPFFPAPVHRGLRLGNGRSRLKGRPYYNRAGIAHPSQDATGVIGSLGRVARTVNAEAVVIL